MLRNVCLFAHDHPSTPDSDWDLDNGQFEGWAEWFNELPLLFLYLLGDAAHPPQIAPCAIYENREAPCCLMAPMTEVRQRWALLQRHIQPRLPGLSAAAQAAWARASGIVVTSSRHWLILDCEPLCAGAIGSAEYEADLERLRQRAAAWRLDAGPWPAGLQVLLERFEAQGWWSPAVIARRYAVEYQDKPDFSPEIGEKYTVTDNPAMGAWEVEAYEVQARKQRGKLRPAQVGLVTEYGRWLVHPDEGATWIGAEHGWIAVDTPEGAGVKDCNGLWVVPVAAGYRRIFVLSPALMACQRPSDPDEASQLRSLPDGRLLFDDARNILPGDDGMLRITHADGSTTVVDALGKPQFSGPYGSVHDFNKKNGLAVVVSLADQREGVAHKSGKLVVPCEYDFIVRGFDTAPPKVFPGGKLLAMRRLADTDERRGEGRPHVYSAKGVLLASPELVVSPYVLPTVAKNRLLAFDGEGPEAEALWFSLEDFSIERTGQSREDYYLKPLREHLFGAGPAKSRLVRREELIAAEGQSLDWMRAVCRILGHGDAAKADALLARWRAGIHEPGPNAADDPSLLTLKGDETLLALYWRHLPADAYEVAHLDWKDVDGLAAIRDLPGTQDWRWDRDEDGYGMDDGLQALATHLQGHDLALVSLDTDGDDYLLTLVRAEDGQDLLDLLAQAGVRATAWL